MNKIKQALPSELLCLMFVLLYDKYRTNKVRNTQTFPKDWIQNNLVWSGIGERHAK